MLAAKTRAAAGSTERAWRHRRMLVAGPLVAIVSLVAAVVVTNAAGLPLRDPDHVAGKRLLAVLVLVALLFVLDVAVRAARRTGRRLPTRAAMARVRRERWTLARGLAVGAALVSFYASYLAYRNLKSVVPLIRPELFDGQLVELDRVLFGGNDPAAVLHALLGTGWATQFFSGAYMLFFIFIPGTLAFALVFTPNLQAGLFYATALSLNWLLGAGSYFLLPSLGPVYAEPSLFSQLPASGVTELQSFLLDQRAHFLADPTAVAAQSIGAFASLHVSIFFTGALAAHLLGLGRTVRIGAWFLLGLTTTATIYLGWHYVLDDIGGVVLGAMAFALASALTGFDVRRARRPGPLSRPSPTPA
jgi:PAP2 superfamily protein